MANKTARLTTGPYRQHVRGNRRNLLRLIKASHSLFAGTEIRNLSNYQQTLAPEVHT